MRSQRSPRSGRSASAPSPSRPSRTSARRRAVPHRAARAVARAARAAGALATVALISVAFAACAEEDDCCGEPGGDRFDSGRAFASIKEQVALGPRPAGSDASRRLAERLREQVPNGTFEPVPGGLRNVVGTLPGPDPAIVVGAHYDTEVEPPDFVGANDGAAGTAAVVELARVLEGTLPEGHREIRFVLFDGEEEPPGCPDARFQRCALRGSKAYVRAHRHEVGEMILLDYIANKGLSIGREQNSNPQLWQQFVEAADRAGASGVVSLEPVPFGVIDDHVPFVLAGIPAIDLIDFSYEFADTSEDTVDKLDPKALDQVGEATAELLIELSRPS